ncbi:MAG: glutamate racemase [Spirochaetales bacterium]|nr:glutamate racemase [Spirochaetales bacterium]
MDSGLGGIPYLDRVRKSRPADTYIYLADRVGFPYGDKSSEFLIHRLNHIAAGIIDLYNPDLMVLACNTASVTALGELRKNFDTPFVGVVPAVKPAAELKSSGTIGVLATDRTVAGEYLKSLISDFAAGHSVETLGAPDLVDFVENTLYRADDDMIFKILKPYVDHLVRNGWTTVVLGCTHFILLKPWLQKFLPQGVGIVDSTEGVGKRILDLLGDKNSDPNPGKGVFHITGTDYNTESYRHTAMMLDLEFSRLEDL